MLADMEMIYGHNLGWNQLKNTKILITGAYGMLASYLVYFFVFLNEVHDYQIDIWVIVRNKDTLRKRFEKYVDRKYFHCIIGELDEAIELEEKMDYIIHAASLASPQYYNTIPVEVILPNVIGTYHLLEYAKRCEVKNFLYFSSSEIYGKQDENINRNYGEMVLGTLDPADLRNCYAEAKRMGENMCVAYASEYGVNTNAVRIFHTFGPTMDVRKDERAFAEFTANVIDYKNIQMKSDGTAKRPFCYIADAVYGFLLIMLKGERGEVYNLSNESNYISIRELAEVLVDIFPERKLSVVREERNKNSQYVAKKDENQVTGDSGKLRKLGWNPEITVGEGFRRTIQAIEEEL